MATSPNTHPGPSSQHVDSNTLKRFVAGRLEEAEAEHIVVHLSECDRCLALADELWSTQPAGTAVVPPPDPDPDVAQRIERKITKRIHFSNLSGEIIRLGTRGFIDVALAIVRPLIHTRVPQKGGVDD